MSKTTILIVEDERIVAEDLAAKLASLGYQVAGIAAAGEEALAMTDRHRPNLVLMDILLEGPMDGIDAADAIRRQYDLPVVYLTAHSDPATLARAKVSGPCGYILKPFEERELATQIELALYQHQADQQVRQQREWLRVTLTSIGDAVIATDAAGQVTFVNPVAESLIGWKTEEAVGQPLQAVFRVINEQTGQPMEDPVVRALKEGRAVALANHAAVVTKEGRTVAIEDSAAPILDAAAACLGAVLVFHDVTAKRRAEEALRESEERFRLMVEEVKDHAIFMLDAQGRVVTWNAGAQRLKGYAAEEIVGAHFARFYPAEDIAAGKPQRELAAAAEQGTFAEEGWRVRKDGSRFWAAVTITALRDEAGRLRGFAKIIRDVSERKRMDEELVEGRQRLAGIVGSAMDAIISVDAAQRIVLFNAAAEKMFRCPAAEAVGQSLDRFIPGQFRAAHAGHIAAFGDAGTTSRAMGQLGTLSALRADGEEFPMEASISQVVVGGQRLFTVILRDITERRQAFEHLQRAKEAADAANEAKSQFLMNMSHELRTPMNSIMGMTELVLGERDLSPMARDCLQTAKGSADGLLELINQILDFSRIEADKLRLESRPFGLREVLDKTLKPLAVRASQKKLELTCDVEADVPNSLIGDPLALQQVLTNLVGNAVKFSHKGDVVVRVRKCEPQGEDCKLQIENCKLQIEDPAPRDADSTNNLKFAICNLQFSISDTGIGISTEDQERLFAPFAQADASLSRQYGGTGLGLAISSRLVALSGGRMWLQSNVGSGSIFHFTLRLGLQPGAGDESETTQAARDRFQNVPVLVVDDNAATRHSVERMLGQWAMKAEAADHAAAALVKLHAARAAGEPFPIVLASAVMPGTDGFSLANWINKDRGLAGSVILMISAVDRQEMADRCQQLKAIYLEKPVSQADLRDALTQALGGETAIRSKPVEPEAGEISPVTANPLRVLVAEDNPPNQKFIVLALRNRGHHVEAAFNGQEALDLLGRHNFDAVLMDLQMPVMDGLEATAAIRKFEEPGKARVPIIALTAHATPADQERCLAAGMDAYISKPVNVGDLFAAVERSAGSL